MTRLPTLSGKQLIRLLLEAGYYVRDQKGSHVHLRHATLPPLTVPNHKAIAKGTLKAILNQAGLKEEE
jgi:predicted RNA binding protein YcfA (HicA-like mRNA interferase family)